MTCPPVVWSRGRQRASREPGHTNTHTWRPDMFFQARRNKLGALAVAAALALSVLAMVPSPAGALSALTGSPYDGSDGVPDAGVTVRSDPLGADATNYGGGS